MVAGEIGFRRQNGGRREKNGLYSKNQSNMLFFSKTHRNNVQYAQSEIDVQPRIPFNCDGAKKKKKNGKRLLELHSAQGDIWIALGSRSIF